MSSTKKEPLFDLIKSLSKSEKRYFLLFAKQHQLNGKNNYLILFKSIVKLPHYDENSIQKNVESFISGKDFTFTKSYLYKMLMKSLNAFHKERISIDSELSEIILSIEILYNKTLYHQAIKLSKKGIKKAELHEKFELQLILEKWNYKILEKLNIENVDAFQTVSAEKISKLSNSLQYKILSDNIYKHVNQLGVSRSEKEIKLLKKLMTSPLLISEPESDGTSAKILYNNTQGLYHYFNTDFDESYLFYKRSLTLFNENKEFSLSNAEAYISTYNNITISSLHLGKKDETKQHIQHLKEYVKTLRDGQLKSTTYLNILSIEIPFYINQGDFKGGLSQMVEISTIYNKYERKFNPIQKVFTQYFVAYLYFGNNEFKEALFWLNKINNTPKINNREDIFVFTRILTLITHFELNHLEILEYQLRSIKTLLSKNERNHELETSAINILKDLTYKNENKSDILKKHKPDFETHIKKERNVFGYFNFLAWIDSNISATSFEDAHKKYL